MDEHTVGIVGVRRAQALEERTDKRRAGLVGKSNDKGYAQQDQDGPAHTEAVAEKSGQHDVKRNPECLGAYKPHNFIQYEKMQSVDREENRLVKLSQKIETK